MSDKQDHSYDLDFQDHQSLTQPGQLLDSFSDSLSGSSAGEKLIAKTIELDNSTINRFENHHLHPAIWIGGSFATAIGGLYYLIYISN